MSSLPEYAKAMQTALVDVGFWKCCLNCNHWGNNNPDRDIAKEDLELKLKCHKYSMIPPPDIILYSCIENWTPIIPF